MVQEIGRLFRFIWIITIFYFYVYVLFLTIIVTCQAVLGALYLRKQLKVSSMQLTSSVPNKVPLSYNWRISFKQAAIVQRLSITHCRTSVIVLISIAATFLLCYICFSFLDVALNLFVYDRIIYFLFFKDRLKPSQDPLRPLYFCINQKTSTVTSSSCAPTLF